MEPDDTPRKLTRSTTDKYLAGVSGGLGRYFGVDALLFRVAFGVSIVFGGVGIVAYLALLAFLPTDDGEPAWIEDKSRATTVVVTVALGIAALSLLSPPSFILGPGLLAVGAFTALGVGLYRAFGGARGDDPARIVARVTLVMLSLVAAFGVATGIGFIAAIGGGVAVAVISIVAGFALIGAGLLGGPRWLILPAIVLVLPLAVVSAANLDLRGGVGAREFRPVSVADLQPEYRIGLGHIDLDLRGVKFPPGMTEVDLRIGMGEAVVRVPDGTCVSTEARMGVGAVDVPERLDDGVDIDVDQSTKVGTRPMLRVNANVGVGHLQIDRDEITSCT